MLHTLMLKLVQKNEYYLDGINSGNKKPLKKDTRNLFTNSVDKEYRNPKILFFKIIIRFRFMTICKSSDNLRRFNDG